MSDPILCASTSPDGRHWPQMDLPPLIDDTIAALASAPGPALRGIVRVSGPSAKVVVSSVFVPDDCSAWETARLPWRHHGTVEIPDVHCPLPVDVFLWPTGRSYTGQPTAELHTIGSGPLLEALLERLFAHGARPAQRGEFTLRAFLAGRIDLMQAEAVLGVIDATDQQQLHLALDQLGGGLSRRIAALHEELLLHLADLEAGLDFVEEDIEFIARDELIRRIRGGLVFLNDLLEQAASRLQSTGRLKVVLAGLPNAGKSTLLNALCGGEAAIVSSASGTTRDYLSVPVEWSGLGIDLIDTAGWDRAGADDPRLSIERAADELRHDQWQRADLILWCSPADIVGATGCDEAAALDARLREECARNGKSVLHLTTKADLSDARSQQTDVPVSATTGRGIDKVKALVVSHFDCSAGDDGILGTTAARCRDSLRGAADALERARAAAAARAGDELVAIELRDALDHLGQIIGRVYTDDILDRIFSRFCIGK